MNALNEHPWPQGPRKGWLPGDIDIQKLRHHLGADEIGVLKRLIADSRATPLYELKPEQFRDPVLDHFVEPLVDQLKQGPGLVLLNGLNAAASNLDELRRAFWGIGTYFGNQVSQSVRGDMMGDIRVRPEENMDRVYTSPRPAPMHSDRIDMLAMVCVQNAMQGGENGFLSSLAVRELIQRERPDVFALLQRGFYQSRGGEEQPGQEAITPYRVPVFAEKDGLISCLFSGNASLVHHRNSVKDELTPAEIEALEYVAEVLARPELRITVALQIGEAVFINNYELTHSRDPFVDSPDEAKKRHLLRMWLAGRPERPLVDEQRVIINPSGRQGIDPQAQKVDASGAIIKHD